MTQSRFRHASLPQEQGNRGRCEHGLKVTGKRGHLGDSCFFCARDWRDLVSVVDGGGGMLSSGLPDASGHAFGPDLACERCGHAYELRVPLALCPAATKAVTRLMAVPASAELQAVIDEEHRLDLEIQAHLRDRGSDRRVAIVESHGPPPTEKQARAWR